MEVVAFDLSSSRDHNCGWAIVTTMHPCQDSPWASGIGHDAIEGDPSSVVGILESERLRICYGV